MNVLMISWIGGFLPNSRRQAWLCSSGSKGYSAFRRSLEPGYPEHTILLTNVDVRDMSPLELPASTCNVPDHCIDYGIFFSLLFRATPRHFPPRASFNRIQTTAIITNLSCSIPQGFLSSCYNLKYIDLSQMSNLAPTCTLPWGFLEECTSLCCIDLTPLQYIKELPRGLLTECRGLKSIDLSSPQ